MILAGLCVLPLLFVTGLASMWLAVLLIGLALALTLVAASFLVFATTEFSPGNVARKTLGPFAALAAKLEGGAPAPEGGAEVIPLPLANGG